MTKTFKTQFYFIAIYLLLPLKGWLIKLLPKNRFFTHSCLQCSLFAIITLLLFSSTLMSAKELVHSANRDSLKQEYRIQYKEMNVNELLQLADNFLGANREKSFVLNELAIEKATLTGDDNELVYAYQNRGYAAEMYHDYEDALKYYKKALQCAPDSYNQIIIYNDMAITYRKAGQYKMCQDYHNLALNLAKETKDFEMIENSYHGIGFLYSKIGDYDEALKYYLLSLAIAEQRADPKNIIISMQNISSIYLKSDNHSKAIESISKAYDLARNLNDTIVIAKVLQDYGKTLKDTGTNEEALNKLQQAIDIYQSKSHHYLIPRGLVYIGDVYMKMKDYEQAENYFKKALQHEKNIEMDVYVHLYNELGQLYLAKNDIPKAKNCFQKALRAAQKNDLKSHSLMSYQNLYKISAQTQAYKEALEYLEKATALDNEMLSKEKTNRIAELQFKYDVAKSDRVLNAMKLRQNKLIMGGSSLLFLLIISFQLYTSRIKAQNNAQLMRKNEEIQQQNIKLKESNAVLQQFAYVAAHDLKEPLRSIGSFVNLLERKHSQNFNEEAKEYMGFVRSSTHRMNNLVTALLHYSTISMEQASYEILNMNKIMEEICHNLHDRILETNGKLDISDLPNININSFHGIQLFQNLISNALKFSDQNPLVTIRGWKETDRVIFSIKDNGIGMNEAYSDKIYKLFHQLNKQNNIEGTGIGLTICKNIVDKYNGEIWFKSKEQQGTEFFVSFPIT